MLIQYVYSIFYNFSQYILFTISDKPMIDTAKQFPNKIIAVQENGDLSIKIHLIANPISTVQWLFLETINDSLCNKTNIKSNESVVGVHLTTSILILGVQNNHIGSYMILSKNNVGAFSQIFKVVLQGL